MQHSTKAQVLLCLKTLPLPTWLQYNPDVQAFFSTINAYNKPPCSISSIQSIKYQIHHWIATIKTEFNSLFLCNSSAIPEEKAVRISKNQMDVSLRSQMCAAGDLGLGCVLTWTSCTATMWAWCQQRTEWSLGCIWLSQNCLPYARRGWQPKHPLKPTDLYTYTFTNHWYYSPVFSGPKAVLYGRSKTRASFLQADLTPHSKKEQHAAALSRVLLG